MSNFPFPPHVHDLGFQKRVSDSREPKLFVEPLRRDLCIQVHALESLFPGDLEKHLDHAFTYIVTAPLRKDRHAADFSVPIEPSGPDRAAVICGREHVRAFRVGFVPFLLPAHVLLEDEDSVTH